MSTEGFVHRLFRRHRVRNPNHLGIDNLSEAIDAPVYFWEFDSEAVFYRGRYKIFLNENLSAQQKWQEFGHECCHIFRHTGNQSEMNNSFLYYQENQATHFAYHFCVPTFMLEDYKGATVYDIMNLFNVEFDFALKRLEMYERKMLDARVYC